MPVKGDRAVAAALRELSRQVAVPLSATSRFALQPTLTQARANARALPFKESSGALAASLTIKQKAGSPKLAPTTQVGPDASYEKWTPFGFRRPVNYAHLDEFGTAPHYQPGRGVTHPGSAPHPFMMPAYVSTRGQVVDRFGKRIGPEMEKRAQKLAAKAAKGK
ncbi:MAG: hypothetical protein E5X38_07385 [Mesorhizobium sp.]|uniref:hypothetical protein n=1 Tax=unclassified Mesorhizobium TaxID=325217 RepID=UPI000FCC6648|nr:MULTISPECIES: hypothetical protein [unclassified Mesorhizobium]RUV12036.1 hypothetical protein EOA91_28820 [Mesorhizobium sp. M1A.F.Ca.IN.022.04.1.1]RUV63487.1 hypothetical protein EOA64_08740 [Mesorhizobium sp. M1A.F.Ca.IN.022.02.1.1]RWG36227.1 MAG: hypothetical protein EOQ60_05175 [Mesorhizobium sp.]TIQ88675.1 MAG: hypothetical protein E5X38_07385 [Mesorhizobium sp.]